MAAKAVRGLACPGEHSGRNQGNRGLEKVRESGRGEGQRSEGRGLGKEPRGGQGRRAAKGWPEGSGGKELSGSGWRLVGSM